MTTAPNTALYPDNYDYVQNEDSLIISESAVGDSLSNNKTIADDSLNSNFDNNNQSNAGEVNMNQFENVTALNLADNFTQEQVIESETLVEEPKIAIEDDPIISVVWVRAGKKAFQLD